MNRQQDVETLYQALEVQFVKWAKTQPDIRAAIVVGSRARTDQPADEWADLDILVFTKTPEQLLANTAWVHHIGIPIITFLEPTASGEGWERRVLFEGGIDVDFAIEPYDTLLQVLESGVTPQMVAVAADTLGRGIRILLDKDQIAPQVLQIYSNVEQPRPRHPTEQEFLEVTNDFWYHALWTAKKLLRGELWWAKGGLDDHMKWRNLLPMIEWYMRVQKGLAYDTWFRGRFLDAWADPSILEDLQGAFAHYNLADMWRALFVTMRLFRRIAKKTAMNLGYSYPARGDEFVTEWIKTRLSERSKE